METKPQASQSFPMETDAVVACEVANAKHCKEVVPEIAVPVEEEGMVACVQRVAIANIVQCSKEISLESELGAVLPQAEEVVVVASAQGAVIAEQSCKVVPEPNVAVPEAEEVPVAFAQGELEEIAEQSCKVMEHDNVAAVRMEEKTATACDQGGAKAKQCKEVEPKFPELPKDEGEATEACTESVVIAEPCNKMKPDVVAVPMEEEAVQEAVKCEQAIANSKQCKGVESKGAAVPMVEETVACDQQVAPDEMVPLLAPGFAKLCGKEMDPAVPVILENEVYLTIEDCSGELPPLPLAAANGDGDGDANGGTKNIGKVIISNGSKVVTERGLIAEPVGEPPVEIPLETPETEASWEDVPDEPLEVPAPMEKTTSRFPKRPRPAPENVEVDDVVQTMRNILMDLRNVDDARLHPDNDAKVRSLLEHHPQAQEKMGSGIDYIKIKRHSIFKDVRCFWVVRTDGTETDFSYHKCLKEKVAKDHPSFVDRYDAIYRAPKRPRQA